MSTDWRLRLSTVTIKFKPLSLYLSLPEAVSLLLCFRCLRLFLETNFAAPGSCLVLAEGRGQTEVLGGQGLRESVEGGAEAELDGGVAERVLHGEAHVGGGPVELGLDGGGVVQGLAHANAGADVVGTGQGEANLASNLDALAVVPVGGQGDIIELLWRGRGVGTWP